MTSTSHYPPLPWLVAACLAFGCLVACGGRASSPEDPAPSEASVPDSPVKTLKPLPEAFEVLELRRYLGSVPPATGFPCDPVDLDQRIKINLRSRDIILETCERAPDLSATGQGSSSHKLSDADDTTVLEAYAQLRVSSGDVCDTSAGVLTLGVRPESGSKLEYSYSDAEHSACPGEVPGRDGFVAGLDALYAAVVSQF